MRNNLTDKKVIRRKAASNITEDDRDAGVELSAVRWFWFAFVCQMIV